MVEFVNPLLRQDFGINYGTHHSLGARAFGSRAEARSAIWQCADQRTTRRIQEPKEPRPNSYTGWNILKGLLTGMLAQSCGIPEGRFPCIFPHSARSAWPS